MRLPVLTFLICLLGGCGQSGALYLPDAPTPTPTPAPAAPADASEMPAGSAP